MITARTIGLGLGLILLLGVGAATFSRAQQPGEKTAHQTPTRTELRERVLKLRTEVDFLQLEYDVARARLFRAIEDADNDDERRLGEIRSQILSRVSQEQAKNSIADGVRLFEALKKARDTKNKQELDAIQSQILTQSSEEEAKKWKKIFDSPARDQAIDDELKRANEEIKVMKGFLRGGQEAEAAADRWAQLEVTEEQKARHKPLRSAIDRQKPEFARKARSLHEKMLDLAEAEKQYQSEAR